MRTLIALAALAALLLAPRPALATYASPDAALAAPADLNATAMEPPPLTPVIDAPVQLAAPAPSAVSWLRAEPLGWPNWQILAVLAWLVVTAILKRTRAVAANEPLELLANLLVRVPLVGWIARAWTTPGTLPPAPPSSAAPAALVLALLLVPSRVFADMGPAYLLRPHQELELAPYVIAGLWTGTFLTARCWRAIELATAGIRRRAAQWTPRRMLAPLALALLLSAGAAGCGATTKQIAATATIATVQTIDDGIGQFAAWATNEEDAIAEAAVRSCAGKVTRAEYNACTSALAAPRRAPIDKAKAAIRIYRAALAGGERLAQGDLAITSQSVVEALAAVGIRVVAGDAP